MILYDQYKIKYQKLLVEEVNQKFWIVKKIHRMEQLSI